MAKENLEEGNDSGALPFLPPDINSQTTGSSVFSSTELFKS